MEEPGNAAVPANERLEIFIDYWGNEDRSLALRDILLAAGDYLTMLVGPKAANAGMAEMVMPVVLADEGTPEEARADWRAALDEHGGGETFTEWAFGSALFGLVAYGRYGIAVREEQGPGCEQWLAGLIEKAVRFCRETPEHWSSGGIQIKHEVMLARNRWAMDNNRPVDPLALAEFGGVSESRIRNMMAGDTRTFHADADKLIPAHEALGWLSGRETFWNSIWREEPGRLTSPRRGYSQPFLCRWRASGRYSIPAFRGAEPTRSGRKARKSTSKTSMKRSGHFRECRWPTGGVQTKWGTGGSSQVSCGSVWTGKTSWPSARTPRVVFRRKWSSHPDLHVRRLFGR